MMHLSKNRALAGVLLLAAPALLLGGCSDSGANQQAQNQPKTDLTPPPPPPAPRATTVNDLRAQLNVDERIQLDETDAPPKDDDRRAVLTFANAFTQESTTELRDLLSPEDQVKLDEVLAADEWIDPQQIDSIYVYTGPNPNKTGIGSSSAQLAMFAVFTMSDGSLQPTLWYLEDGRFASAILPDDVMDRMTGPDHIDAWHQVLDTERSLGMRDEIPTHLPRQILEQRRRGTMPQDPDNPNPPAPPAPIDPGSPGSPPGAPGAPGIPL